MKGYFDRNGVRPLSALDSAMLIPDLHDQPQAIAVTAMVDTSTCPEPVTADSLTRRVADRYHDKPLMHLRYQPTALGRGVWVYEPQLEWERHVHHRFVDGELDDVAVRSLMASRFREPFDWSRPPWDLYCLQERNGNRLAYVHRIHHSCGDGIFGFFTAGQMFDSAPSASDADPESDRPLKMAQPATGSVTSLRRRTLWGYSIKAKQRAAKAAPGMAREWWQAERRRREIRQNADPRLLAPKTGAETPWARQASSRRPEVHLARLDAALINQVRRRLSVRFNDVLLAVVAGAFRTMLQESEDGVPSGPMLCSFPASTRSIEGFFEPGNQVASYNTPLPVHIDDPLERVEFVREAQRLAKNLLYAGDPTWSARSLDYVPLRLTRWLYRAYALLGLARYHPPLIDTCVTSFPAPFDDAYLLGGTVTDVFATSGLTEQVHVDLVAVTVGSRLTVSIAADSVNFPSGALLGSCLERELEKLADTAGAVREPSTPNAGAKDAFLRLTGFEESA